MLEALRHIRAGQYSRRNDHARALAYGGLSHPGILSRAGMHLSVLGFSDWKEPNSRIQAQLALGGPDEAFNIAEKDANLTRQTLGALAAADPNRALKQFRDLPEFEAFSSICDFSQHGCEPASLRHGRDPVLEFMKAVGERDQESQNSALAKIYSAFNLDPPYITTRFISNLGDLTIATPHKSQHKPPLVSIILTAYNEEENLAHAVRSILDQTWKNIELIIVDDASTDLTNQIAQDLRISDSRIIVISQSENHGTWHCKNIGIEASSGDFIMMHDADDWSHPLKIEIQIQKMLINNSIMATSSYFYRINTETGSFFTRNFDSFLRWNPSSLLYRRKVIDEVGVYYEDILGGDCEYSARIETYYRPEKHLRIRLPLSIGLNRHNSLSNKFRNNASRVRIEHWEKWRSIHVQNIRMGTSLRPTQASMK